MLKLILCSKSARLIPLIVPVLVLLSASGAKAAVTLHSVV